MLPIVPNISIRIPITFNIPQIVFSLLFREKEELLLGSGNELLKVAPQSKHFPDAFSSLFSRDLHSGQLISDLKTPPS